MKCIFFLALIVPAAAVINLRKAESCEAEDMKHRMQLQNKLAGDCENMCKEVGAYPDHCTCPDFVMPDRTPGVVTWEELLGHMDQLVEWSGARGLLKTWAQQASQLQKKAQAVVTGALSSKACAAMDLKHRAQVQNKLATACEDMCKEVGAYPKCECPGFAPPDATPGVMTWEELLEHMDNLEAWGQEMIKKAKARAGSLLQNATQAKTQAKTRVCIVTSIHSKTNTQATNASNTVGVTDWKNQEPAENTCTAGGPYTSFKLCGPATLHLYTSNGGACASPDTTITHGTDKTMADCTEETKSSGYWHEFKYTCGAGNR